MEGEEYTSAYYHGEFLPRKLRTGEGVLQPASIKMRLRRTMSFSTASSSSLSELSTSSCGLFVVSTEYSSVSLGDLDACCVKGMFQWLSKVRQNIELLITFLFHHDEVHS